MENWKIRAIQLYQQALSWKEIYEAINKEFGTDYTYDKIRDYIRKTAEYRNDHQGIGEKPQTPKVEELGETTLLKHLGKMRTLDDLAEITGNTKRVILAHIEDLKEQGYEIHNENNKYWLQTNPITSDNEHKANFNGETEIKFALIADTHLGNKYQQLTHLNDFYDRCVDNGVKKVYHCGDISDGFYKQRDEQVYELHKHGVDEQADYIIGNYPYRDSITTDFITGNHDNTHLRNGGANIGKRIAAGREDMNYLGIDYAKIWLTPKCDMDLIHPGDGSAYALSYKMQKRIDAIQGGAKPLIMATGHYHKQFYMLYRNIHSFAVPCFEAQTPFMRSKGLISVVGGWIITIKTLKTGEIREIEPKAINYYFMKDNDY